MLKGFVGGCTRGVTDVSKGFVVCGPKGVLVGGNEGIVLLNGVAQNLVDDEPNGFLVGCPKGNVVFPRDGVGN